MTEKAVKNNEFYHLPSAQQITQREIRDLALTQSTSNFFREFKVAGYSFQYFSRLRV